MILKGLPSALFMVFSFSSVGSSPVVDSGEGSPPVVDSGGGSSPVVDSGGGSSPVVDSGKTLKPVCSAAHLALELIYHVYLWLDYSLDKFRNLIG